MKKNKAKTDLILIRFPILYYLQLPSGMGYAHNILKKCSINFTTYDLNEKFYNFYLKDIDNIDTEISKNILNRFLSDFSAEIVKKKTKIIAISIDSVEYFLKESLDIFISNLKQKYPEIIFIAGGQSCFHHNLVSYI